MFKGLLYSYLLKAVLVVALALVLYGVYPGTGLAIILALFAGLRLTSIAVEALREPVPPERREATVAESTRRLEQLTPEERAAQAIAFGRRPHSSARELRQAQGNNARGGFRPPRSKLELSAEALGVVAFAIFIPLDIALYTRDFFSFRTPQGWEGACIAALGLVLYAWPHRWLSSPGFSFARTCWWALPFIPAILLFDRAIETRHPYLNPFDPEHNRLAAERVLALKNNIVAGRHADWVLRYARQLDERGKPQQAIPFYREGLRLDPHNREAYARLASLEVQLSGPPAGNGAQTAFANSGPYWTTRTPVTKSPRLRIDSQLENVEGCTTVIVAVGDVSDAVLDAVGHVVHHELDLPVYISPDAVPLPPHTRVRGLVTGPQWDLRSLVQVFLNTTRSFPKAPIKYLLITPADIYSEDANYVFSASYSWGAVVSSARFGNPQGDDSLLRQRTAKQALCGLLKSFSIPISPDRNCVTSYAQNLEEFDAKGTRPNAATLALYRQAVADLNRTWQERKSKQ
jgi:predicted Zn-dependent protease